MSNKTSLLGSRGFKGPQGPVGPQGDKGDKGDTGSDSISYWQLNSSSNTLSPINNYSVNKSNIVGLENVDNISDLNKPISTATQYALNLKANKSYVDQKIQEIIVDNAPPELDTLNEIANALNNDSHLATTLTNSIELKAPKISPTFTGTVSGITSEMIKPNNIVINTSDLDSSGNFILNTNNFKDGSSIINTSIISSPLVGNGLSGTLYAICADLDPSSNDIYIGGGFTSATNSNGIPVPSTTNICKYNTETGLYSAVGKGINNVVRTICAIPNSDGTSRDIYIGGTFTIATNSDNSTINVNRICIYNTSSKRYTTVGNGLSGNCFAICADPSSNDIYIGGSFNTAYNTGTTTVSNTRNICIYNTSSKVYRKVGNGLEKVSYALCVVPNLNGSRDIYIGGQFTSATNSDNSTVTGTSKICKYNTGSESYSALGKGLDNLNTSNYCYSICADPSSNDIYIGGQFTRATNSDNSTVTVNNICKYNTENNSYYAVGNGINGFCNAIRAVPNLNGTSRDIYIAGQFYSAYNSGTTVIPGTTGICKYNTGTLLYSAVGNGLSGFCYALCAVPNSTDMYIGGDFSSIIDSNKYSLPVIRICKINSSINIYNYNINIYYKNTLISSINPVNPFEVIQKNTNNSKEYITLVGSNKKFLF